MACNSAQGAQTRYAIEQNTDLTSAAQPLAVYRDTLEQVIQVADPQGMWGTRSLASSRARAVRQFVRGSWWLQPTPNDLDVLLPLILGVAEATDVFAIGEPNLECTLAKDLDTDLWQYNECHVTRAVFEGQAGGFVDLRLDFVGKEEVAEASWLPSAISQSNAADEPYVFADADNSGTSRLVINSNALEMTAFRITIDNHIEPRFVNSLTPTSFCPAARDVKLDVVLPYSTANELAAYTDGTTEVAASLTFVNGNVSTLFNFPALVNEPRTPKVRGKTEILHEMSLTARASGTTANTYELKVTHDANAAT